MTLTIVFVSAGIILSILFLANHWKGILKMVALLFLGYLAVGCIWDAAHGYVSGGAIVVVSILAIAVGVCFFGLLKRL